MHKRIIFAQSIIPQVAAVIDVTNVEKNLNVWRELSTTALDARKISATNMEEHLILTFLRVEYREIAFATLA